MEEYISEVSIDQIRVSPFQPRRQFSEEELKELADSILQIGLIQPPVVRKIVQKDKILYYELIAGERRWRASEKAGLKKIPVIVRSSTDHQAAEASLIENIQRVDLNPLEMAEAFRKLMEVFCLTQEEIADRVGKKRSTIANYLRLLTLPPSICEGLQKGAISMGHAKAILSLEDPELKEMLFQLIQKDKLTVREAEQTSLNFLKKEKKIKEKDIHIVEIERNFEEKFKTKVRFILEGKKSGKIVFHYYDLDDLDRLLDLFAILRC